MRRDRLAAILVLFCIACAAPVMNIIADGPAFFVNRRATPIQIISFVIVMLLGIPALISGIIELLNFVSKRLSALFLHTSIAALAALAVLPVASSLNYISGEQALLLALLTGCIASLAYWRWGWTRKTLMIFLPLVLIVPLKLATNADLRGLIFPKDLTLQTQPQLGDPNHNVVVVIFDEFSLNSLMTESGEIDGKRFPHFARLASQSTWYRNTTAVNQFTPLAVPAILSGLFPKEQNQLPTTQQYPTNLFTVLSRTHDIKALEPFTKLCPEQICKSRGTPPSFGSQLWSMLLDASAVYLAYALPGDLELGNPDIDGKWGDFWNDETADWDAPNFDRGMRFLQYREFISRIQPQAKPALHFIHMILPHMPFQFTASGFSYPPGSIRVYAKDHWIDNPSLQKIAYTQYLTQVGTADGLLGRLMARMEETGMWDDALVVIAADHGVSFQPNTYRRGHPKQDSFYQDVMSVPFFLKLPRQRQGQVSDRNVETIDILPTIIDALHGNTSTDIKFDGRSALSTEEKNSKNFFVGRIPGKVESQSDQQSGWGKDLAGSMLTFPVPQVYPMETIRWKYSLPGYRSGSSANQFYIGPLPELLKVRVSELGEIAQSSSRYQIKSPKIKDGALMMKGGAGTCPCLIQGVLTGSSTAPGQIVALAINGTIETLGETFILKDDPSVYFSFLTTERSFKPGSNKPELFTVTGDSRAGFSLSKIELAK
jgi:hypothetical protein